MSGVSCTQITSTNICNHLISDPVYHNAGKTAGEACCNCGGSDFQLVAPSEIPSDQPSSQPSLSAIPTVISDAPSYAPSDIASDVPSLQPSDQPSQSPSGCNDEPYYLVFDILTCADLSGTDADGNAFDFCDNFEGVVGIPSSGKTAQEACCACGGGTLVPAPVIGG